LEQDDENFDIDMLTSNLYQELTNRHVYARCTLDSDIRKNSWDNYMDLFETILREKDSKRNAVELPAKWVWDMLDEFIYQFQNFCYFRNKMKNNQDANYNM